VITRAVGHNAEVDPDLFAFTVEAGDRLLLCSDGLHGLIENAELARIVGTEPLEELEEAVRALIALARERGGPDNITALAVGIDQLGAAADDASAAVTTPIVIGVADDTPRVLPRLDDVEMVDEGAGTLDEQPTMPTAAATPPPPPPRTAPKAAPRAPVWLFVVVPIVIVTLLVAGSFFFIAARRGDRQETAQPAGAPAATSIIPVAATSTLSSASTALPTTTPPPAPTTTPIAIEGRLPTVASTPTATKEGGFVAPALPPPASASPTSTAWPR